MHDQSKQEGDQILDESNIKIATSGNDDPRLIIRVAGGDWGRGESIRVLDDSNIMRGVVVPSQTLLVVVDTSIVDISNC